MHNSFNGSPPVFTGGFVLLIWVPNFFKNRVVLRYVGNPNRPIFVKQNQSIMNQQQTKKIAFLTLAHKLWISEILEMSDFIEILWTLMLKYNVRWEENPDVETSSKTEGFTTEELFAENLNCEAYNDFLPFVYFCSAYMDFSQMAKPQTLKAFLNLN